MTVAGTKLPRGLTTCLARAFTRYRSIVIVGERHTISLCNNARELGVTTARRRTYHRNTYRVAGVTRVSRTDTYGTNKAAIVELERVGVAVVACGEAAECLRVAARRLGMKLTVRRIGAGPYRRVELVKPAEAA